MTTTPIDNTSITPEFNVDELTEGTLTGKGVFDVLLQTLRLHLDREFTSGRITGTAYATVYSQAITAFLGQAVEFTLAKSKLGLELERMREEVALVKLQQDKLLAETAQVKFNTDEILPLQKDKINADIVQTYKQTNLITQQLENLISEQLGIQANTTQTLQQTENLKVQEAQLKVEVKKSSYELDTTLPEQVELIRRNQRQVAIQTQLADYELTYIKPVELNNLTLAGLDVTAKTALTTQQTANLTTENSNLVKQGNLIDSQKVVQDKQALSIEAGTAEVTYRTNYVLPSQVAQNDAQTASTVYSTANLLPKQVAQMQSQIDTNTAQTALYEQKTVTELAQTTTTPASGSVMGVQNDLMATQKASYLRDAEQKASKMLIDTWNVRRNADPTSNPVTVDNRLRDADIGSAVGKMLTGIGVV